MGCHPNEKPETRAKRLAYNREYNKRYLSTERGKAISKASRDKWRKSQGEKLLEKKREYYRKNREKHRQRNKEFYERLGTTPAEFARKWRRDNPEIVKSRRKEQYKRSIGHIIADFRAGRIDFAEFDRRLRNSIVRAYERCGVK